MRLSLGLSRLVTELGPKRATIGYSETCSGETCSETCSAELGSEIPGGIVFWKIARQKHVLHPIYRKFKHRQSYIVHYNQSYSTTR